jgi:hypothetical protein
VIAGRGAWLVAASAAAVLASGVAVAWHESSRTDGQTALRIADDPPPILPSVPVPTASVAPTATPRVPVVLTTLPDPVASLPPTVTAVPTGVPVDEQCLRPPRPDDTPDASCDALHPHAGLPHPCLGLGYACEWPDARGVVTGGCFDISAVVRSDSVRATWRVSDYDLKGNHGSGPVHHMLVTLADHDGKQAVVQRLFPVGVTSTVFEGVAPGDYQVMFQELNDSGLSNSTGRYATVAGAAPSPSPTPAPDPTGSPEPTPTP